MKRKNDFKLIQIRLRNEEDIKLYERWKETNKINDKESINNKLVKIVIDEMQNKESQNAFNAFKNDLFYAFRKSNFASLTPFYNSLTKQNEFFEKLMLFIDLKLNAILNLLITTEQIDAEIIKNSDDIKKYITDWKFFENLETQIKKEKDKSEALAQKENNIVQKRFEAFKNYFENSDLGDKTPFEDK